MSLQSLREDEVKKSQIENGMEGMIKKTNWIRFLSAICLLSSAFPACGPKCAYLCDREKERGRRGGREWVSTYYTIHAHFSFCPAACSFSGDHMEQRNNLPLLEYTQLSSDFQFQFFFIFIIPSSLGSQPGCLLSLGHIMGSKTAFIKNCFFQN